MNRVDADLVIRAATGGVAPNEGEGLLWQEGHWRFVELTAEVVGAAEASHTHSGEDIDSGTISAARIPEDLSSKGVCGKGTLPTAGVDGRLWLDTADSLLKRDNGVSWETV